MKKGYKQTKNTKEKHRQAALKQFKGGMPEKTKTKIKNIIKKEWKEPTYRRKTTKSIKEAFARPEVKKKMGKSQMGNTNGFKKGNKLSVGKKNGRWKGGISYNPYPPA